MFDLKHPCYHDNKLLIGCASAFTCRWHHFPQFGALQNSDKLEEVNGEKRPCRAKGLEQRDEVFQYRDEGSACLCKGGVQACGAEGRMQ